MMTPFCAGLTTIFVSFVFQQKQVLLSCAKEANEAQDSEKQNQAYILATGLLPAT